MLILVAHGSRDPRWRASVERMVRTLQGEVGDGRVRLAYMDCAPPTLTDVVAELVREGGDRARVLPLFLTVEGHVDRDIRPLVDEIGALWPEFDLELIPPMGRQPEFRRALGRIVERTAVRSVPQPESRKP